MVVRLTATVCLHSKTSTLFRMNVVKAVRHNWKKTVALVGVGALGFKFVQKKYRSVILLSHCYVIQHVLVLKHTALRSHSLNDYIDGTARQTGQLHYVMNAERNGPFHFCIVIC